MKDQETADYLRTLLPKAVRDHLGNSNWNRMTAGQSGDYCFRVQLNNGENAYLKSHFGNHLEEPHHEVEVSQWLQHKVPAAQIIANGKSETSAHWFNLWSEVKGEPIHDLVGRAKPEDIVRVVAETAAKLHQLGISDCKLDQKLDSKIPKALQNAGNGLVRIGALDPSRKGWTVEKLASTLKASIPKSEDLVFTHGDFCLPNIISLNGELSGVIDFGRAGIADRHQDIALALRSFNSNLGGSCEELFLKHYGLVNTLDRDKLEFYQLMDEFF